jgi:hypothetical protein
MQPSGIILQRKLSEASRISGVMGAGRHEVTTGAGRPLIDRRISLAVRHRRGHRGSALAARVSASPRDRD